MNTIKQTTKKQYLSSSVYADYFYIHPTQSTDKNVVMDSVIEQIKANPNFSLGEYVNEEKLKNDLQRKIFGVNENSILMDMFPHESSIAAINENILQKSFDILPIAGNITVYIIPFINEQASKDLDGVNAFTVEENIMYLLIDINNPNWKKSLTETIPHEYAHLVYTHTYPWNSILDGIVNEGLAEHFRRFVVGGEIAPWSSAISQKNAMEELGGISEKVLNMYIDESNVDFYVSYFFGTGDLPKWYGYSIGYWLIDDLVNKKNNNLMELFKKNPKQIVGLYK